VLDVVKLTPEAERVVLQSRVAALEAEAGGMTRQHAAWLRYGKRPVGPDEVEKAAALYRIAVLQPWELAALQALKALRPDMIVLCYKCLSSTRSTEQSKVTTASGVSFSEAEEVGETWFAHRPGTGKRVEWSGYPGHWQMAVWNKAYRHRWVDNVTEEAMTRPWDGVFADNDVFDDYYDLEPMAEVSGIHEVRAALDLLVREAGERLNAIGKLLVPNIAEARREPGRWGRHARYGGGFEEHWLGWQPEAHFDEQTCEEQASELHGPGISVVRVNLAPESAERSFRYAVSAFWVLGAGRGWACTATEPDDYEGLPYIREQAWDLGNPVGPVIIRDGGRAQRFTGGWAAVNLSITSDATFEVPDGLIDDHGRKAPSAITLPPKDGRIFILPTLFERWRPPEVVGPLLALDTRSNKSDFSWLELTGDATVDAGLLRLPIRANYADSVITRATFCASGCMARARLDIDATGESAEMLLQLRSDDGESVVIGKSGSFLLLRLDLRGKRSNRKKAFHPTRHNWWGLAIDADRIRWQTSHDGVKWRTERELIEPHFCNLRVRLALLGGHFDEDAADEEAAFGAVEVVKSSPRPPEKEASPRDSTGSSQQRFDGSNIVGLTAIS